MPPSREYLLREDHPAMKTAMVFNELMAKKKIMAESRGKALSPSPIGRKPIPMRAGIISIMGARKWKSLSDRSGTMSSLINILMPSAIG